MTIAEEEDYMLMRHRLSRHKNRDIALTSSDTTTIKRVSLMIITLQSCVWIPSSNFALFSKEYIQDIKL